MLIALEGLEGVGKTTLGTRVAERLRATYIKSPPPGLDPVRGFVADASDPAANFYFYLAGLCLIQREIEAALQTGPVIVDRYIHSTIAYHAFGRSFDAPTFERSVIRPPDTTLVIICPHSTRADRMRARGHHIFVRRPSDEQTIERYLLDKSDIVFENSADLEQSVDRLTAVMSRKLATGPT